MTALEVNASSMTLSGVRVVKNSVVTSSQGTGAYGGNVRLVVPKESHGYCIRDPNGIQSGGAALFYHDVDVLVSDSLIAGGLVDCPTGVGGALSVSSGGNIRLDNVTIDACSAGFGGGLAFGDDSSATCDATLSNVTFLGNTAPHNSAALMHKCSGNLTVVDTSMSLMPGTQQVCHLLLRAFTASTLLHAENSSLCSCWVRCRSQLLLGHL